MSATHPKRLNSLPILGQAARAKLEKYAPQNLQDVPFTPPGINPP